MIDALAVIGYLLIALIIFFVAIIRFDHNGNGKPRKKDLNDRMKTDDAFFAGLVGITWGLWIPFFLAIGILYAITIYPIRLLYSSIQWVLFEIFDPKDNV